MVDLRASAFWSLSLMSEQGLLYSAVSCLLQPSCTTPCPNRLGHFPSSAPQACF